MSETGRVGPPIYCWVCKKECSPVACVHCAKELQTHRTAPLESNEGEKTDRIAEIGETARLLLNEDIEVSREHGEPKVERRLFDKDDPSAGDTCYITVGGGETIAIVEPYAGDTLDWYAEAIARSGWEMLELIEIITGLKAKLAQQQEHFKEMCDNCGESDELEDAEKRIKELEAEK